MPSTDELWESQSVQSLTPKGSKDRNAVQVLWNTVLSGAEYIYRALVAFNSQGEGRHGSEIAGNLKASTGGEGSYFTCSEEVTNIGWEKQPLEGDTDLRVLSVFKRPYLAESENDEFLSIKLNAIRQTFEIIIADPVSRQFLKETGFSLLGGLLALARKRTVGFKLMWDNLMTFVETSSNWIAISEECQEAGMQTPCFYDIFYESIVLKLLECGEHIPAVLQPTLHTPWISQAMKKTTVMFYAWSQIKKKRAWMTRDLGLYHHLYEVFDYIDPELMWAAFALQSEAKDYYFLLRNQVLANIRYIFGLQRSSYDSPGKLAVIIFSEWQRMAWHLQCYLEENGLFNKPS